MKQLTIFFTTAVLSIVVLSGTVTAQGEQPQPTPTLDPTGLVASVNGRGITLEAYERALSRIQQQSTAADPEALSEAMLDTLIQQEIINQAAEELQIVVTDEQVEAELTSMVELAGSPEAWQAWLTENNYTEDEFRQLSREMLLTNQVRDSIASTSDGMLREVNARHILVATEAEARDILTRLQNGEDFAALALELSRDVTTRERGGDLGFFTAINLTTPELAEIALSLEPGQIAGPVATQLGYHIVQTLEFREREATVEEQAQLLELVFTEWLQERLESATIERYLA